ncbi:MAG: alpha-keto acid decarboxylase family protein [Parachlamydiaceae bacterium]|nr:alpha-keto acid decarboxylase family protein [Parachlamydiaceae bacterium]
MSIGKYLLDALQKRGVNEIFGVPGDYILRFDKMIEQHSIRYINATRENTAGYMADAYARLHGLGVACITYGVGINITNALSQAFVESSPLVVISGSAASSDYSHEIKLHHLINQSKTLSGDKTQLDIFKYITAGQVVLDNPATATEQIDRILDLCLKVKKPVYIEIPRDMVDAALIAPKKIFYPTQEKSDAHALEEAMHEFEVILKTCHKPVIWVGHEIQRFQMQAALLAFAEKYRIPIVSSLLGKTTISEYHPLFVGVYQGEMSRPEVVEFVNNCDCLFMMGLMLTDVETGIFTAKLDQDLKVIASSDGIEIGHHHYKKVIFSDFIQRLAKSNFNVRFHHEYPASIDRDVPHFKPKSQTKTTTKFVFECIQHHLKRDHIIVADIGDSLFASADLILEQDSFLACASFGSLGFATPGSIGAQICRPQHRIIAIVGDGAFQMTSMELSTAVRYGLDPILIILNNHGYATERPIIDGAYNDIHDWNYAEIPKVINGGIGIKVGTEDELDNALKKALSQRGTFYLIEVELDKMDFSPAMLRFSSALKKSKE